MARWNHGLTAGLLLLAGTPAAAQDVPSFIDAHAADPLAQVGQYLGGSPEVLKRAFPARKGVALASQCATKLYSRDKGGQVYTVDLVIKGPGCFDLGMQALRRAYGEPAGDGYGYASVLGNSVTHQSVMVLKWCPAGYDVLVVQQAGWRDGIYITVARQGWFNPKTGRHVEAGSAEWRASCPAGKG
jgi:hypothetical protein